MMLDNINAPQWMQLKLTPKTSNYGVIFLNAVSYPCLCRSRNQINTIIKILVDDLWVDFYPYFRTWVVNKWYDKLV